MTKLQTKASHYGAEWQTEMTTLRNRPTKAMLEEAKFLRRERRDTEVRIITEKAGR